jgi:hypothetical protein
MRCFGLWAAGNDLRHGRVWDYTIPHGDFTRKHSFQSTAGAEHNWNVAVIYEPKPDAGRGFVVATPNSITNMIEHQVDEWAIRVS